MIAGVERSDARRSGWKWFKLPSIIHVAHSNKIFSSESFCFRFQWLCQTDKSSDDKAQLLAVTMRFHLGKLREDVTELADMRSDRLSWDSGIFRSRSIVCDKLLLSFLLRGARANSSMLYLNSNNFLFSFLFCQSFSRRRASKLQSYFASGVI